MGVLLVGCGDLALQVEKGRCNSWEGEELGGVELGEELERLVMRSQIGLVPVGEIGWVHTFEQSTMQLISVAAQ
jgi:hypothetical protein